MSTRGLCVPSAPALINHKWYGSKGHVVGLAVSRDLSTLTQESQLKVSLLICQLVFKLFHFSIWVRGISHLLITCYANSQGNWNVWASALHIKDLGFSWWNHQFKASSDTKDWHSGEPGLVRVDISDLDRLIVWLNIWHFHMCTAQSRNLSMSDLSKEASVFRSSICFLVCFLNSESKLI